MTLELDHYIAALLHEGPRLATVLVAAGPEAQIVTCPDWTMRDLVLHQGEVHRWAAAIVNGAVAKPSALDPEYLGDLPTDDDLLAWFLKGHAAVIEALQAAPADLACFTFLADPPTPLLFWARRQTHETEIHRVDAESAVGANTAISPALAADGVDEMLTGFAPRKHTPLHSDSPVSLEVTLDDAPGRWRMTISDDPPITERTGHGDDRAAADCSISGTANDVYQALWNRSGTESLQVGGDPSVFDLFRENVKVRWS